MKQGKTVSVIGLGYIGLPTAAVLATNGYKVNGCDLNADIVKTVSAGDAHIDEPGLKECVSLAVEKGQLLASDSLIAADVYLICVPTPVSKGDFETLPTPNISHVESAAREIARCVKDGDLIILESTSPVGTTEQVENILIEEGIDTSDIYFAYCPERVIPGSTLVEIIENPRVVGGLTDVATEAAADFYSTFVTGDILKTNAKTAELCKLTENTFRDVNIAFANELSLVCAENEVNVWELIDLANCHPRVNVLSPGTGVGGHCIAVDPWFLISSAPQNTVLAQAARAVNDYKPTWVADQIASGSRNGYHRRSVSWTVLQTKHRRF